MPRPIVAMSLVRRPAFPAVLLSVLALAVVVADDEVKRENKDAASAPLYERIDAVIDAPRLGPARVDAGDAGFLRRVYLDLVGVIPTAGEARAFLDDTSPDKRARLIDRLLADPRFARHMAVTFDVMLMERRPDKHIKSAPWSEYLLESFRAGKPLDRLAREILSADGADDKLRPAARFYLDREGELNLLTRDVGRMFLGRDMQCAQCHDHPVIGDYFQGDYYGLYAFLNRGFVFTDAKKKVFFAEKAEGDVTFSSVFIDNDDKHAAGPRLPGGPPVAEPALKKDELYVVKPAKNVRPVPKFSRRAKLAELVTRGDCGDFNRNLANRLWAHLMGRGLVHPLDLHHEDNPPSHPRLLELLAGELAAMKYDAREFLRQIALSRTYQQGFSTPAELNVPADEARRQLAERTAEHDRLVALAEKTKEFAQAAAKLADAKKKLAAAEAEVDAAEKAVAAARTAVDAARKVHQTAVGEAEKKAAQATAVADLAAAAKQTAEKLPEDKVLAEASAKIAERARQLAEEAAAAKKTVEERAAAVTSAGEAVAKAEQSVAQAQQQRAAALKMVEAAPVPGESPPPVTGVQVASAAAAMVDARLMLAYAEATNRDDAQQLDKEIAVQAARNALAGRWNRRFFTYGLQPLSPEQMAMSMMQATGQLAQRRAAAEKAARDKAAKENKPVDEAELAAAVEAAVYKVSQGDAAEFVKIFQQGQGQPTEDYEATVEEALYLTNGSRALAWLRPSGDNLAQRLVNQKDPAAVAEQLYLGVHTRRPDEQETAAVADYLKLREKDRADAVQEMIWGLLTSTEFRFNH